MRKVRDIRNTYQRGRILHEIPLPAQGLGARLRGRYPAWVL